MWNERDKRLAQLDGLNSSGLAGHLSYLSIVLDGGVFFVVLEVRKYIRIGKSDATEAVPHTPQLAQ